MTTTARPLFFAAAIASTTRRKSRATSTSGSDSRKAEKLRFLPGGDANSAAATLLGRRSIGTVRTFERSTSEIVLEAALPDVAAPPAPLCFEDVGREGLRLPSTGSAMGSRA